ncbi:MAG: GAF domain-containing sensor histidine kinase [Pseudomonadota bacterium]
MTNTATSQHHQGSAIENPARLAELHATGLLDSPPEESFDRFTRLASALIGIPLTLVTLVDRDRQFFKSQVGLDDELAAVRETPLERSFCKHVVESGQPLIIEDARLHSLVRDNPAVKDGAIAYIGMPLITPEGQTLGTFCAVDDQPHFWNERDIRIMRDLAATVMTEIELRLLAGKLLAQYNQLRATELQRDDMAQMLVHDLRNPLTSLLAGLHLIDEVDALDPMQAQALQIARRGGDALLRMVNEILEVSKYQAGHLQLDYSSVNIPDLLTLAREQVGSMAERASIRLEQHSDDQLPACQLDADKLRRVLVNLLANAIQHTAAGGGVSLNASLLTGGRLEIRVSDNGLGIPSEQIARIFDKFNSGCTARHLGSSTGLGLSFCKLVVEAHGGSISVDSKLDRGSTFTLMLPVTPPRPN